MNHYLDTDAELTAKWGAKLRELRLAANISQQDLADKAGMSRSSIAAIEKGRNFSIGSLIAVLRHLKKLDLVSAFFIAQEHRLSPMEIYEREQNKRKRGGYSS